MSRESQPLEGPGRKVHGPGPLAVVRYVWPAPDRWSEIRLRPYLGLSRISLPSGSTIFAYQPQGRLVGGVLNWTPFAFSAAHAFLKSPGRSNCIPDSPGSTGKAGSKVEM